MKSEDLYQKLLDAIHSDPTISALTLIFAKTGKVDKQWIDKMISSTFIVMRNFYQSVGISESEEDTLREVEKIVYETFVGSSETRH